MNSNLFQIHIEGATCVSCMRVLETLPVALPKVVGECSFDLGRSLLKLRLIDRNRLEEVFQQIREMGFKPHLVEAEDELKILQRKNLRHQLVDLGVAGALAGNIMLLSVPLYTGAVEEFRRLFEFLSFLLAVPSLFYCGRSFFKNFYTSLIKKQFSIDAPILVAILIAFFYSAYSYFSQTHELYFDSVSALIFLLLASRYYLARLQNSNQLSLHTLQYFQEGKDRSVGEVVKIDSGVLDFDGVVRIGEIWVDTSKFSGESVPVCLRVGDSVYAGTEVLSQSGPAFVEVQFVGENTRIAKLLESIQFAQLQRPDVALKSDRLAKTLLKVVLVVSVFSLGLFFSRGLYAEGIRRILALLIVTCPCALALGTPLVFAVAMKKLLGLGVMVKNPDVFEKISKIRKIVFDKTGTLTEGKITIFRQIGTLSRPEQNALYTMVCRSQHPVSCQIQAMFQSDSNAMHEKTVLKFFREIPGSGLEGTDLDGNTYELKTSESEFGEDSSVVFKKNSVEVVEYFFQDRIRQDSAETIKKLKFLGYHTELLSGDKEGPVQKLAQSLGIEKYQARCSPEDKALQVKGKVMIGDGLNDALAISQAEVGIAVRGGLKAAIESSEVYSIKSGVSSVLDLIYFSRMIYKTIRRNFFFSTSYNFIGAALSLSGWMSPLFAAVLMPMSATTVFVFTLYQLNRENRTA